MASKETITREIDGQEVTISSPNKVFFSKRGETKLDLIEYYLTVAAPLMNVMRGRPTLLQRFPDGASGKSFFQKRVPKSAPEWLETVIVSTPNLTESNALVIADMAHVVWAVNQGCLGFHPWPFHAATPDATDELRIDLDPSPGVDFNAIREAAVEVKTVLDELGMPSWIKTSGSRGLHIYVRLTPNQNSYIVRAGAVALARELERRRPDLLTAAWWKEERGERVFVDYNQNAPHKTVFGAWCVRPRVGAQVSTPFPWSDVHTVNPEELTIATVPSYLADRGDAWATINDNAVDIAPLIALYKADMDNGMMDAPWPPQYPKMPNEPPRIAPSRAKKADN